MNAKHIILVRMLNTPASIARLKPASPSNGPAKHGSAMIGQTNSIAKRARIMKAIYRYPSFALSSDTSVSREREENSPKLPFREFSYQNLPLPRMEQKKIAFTLLPSREF